MTVKKSVEPLPKASSGLKNDLDRLRKEVKELRTLIHAIAEAVRPLKPKNDG